MESATALPWLIGLIDGLTLVFVGVAVRLMRRIGWITAARWVLPLVIWGVAWAYLPELVALRRNTQFGILISISTAVVYLPLTMRRFEVSATAAKEVLRLAGWRVVFGGLLGIIGGIGGLPAGFYLSAAAGDIAVGIAGLGLLAQGRVSNTALLVWHSVGLFDLVHVLAVGAIYLVPFFSANPAIPIFGLLPIVGVPIFIALHVVAVRSLRAKAKKNRGPDSGSNELSHG